MAPGFVRYGEEWWALARQVQRENPGVSEGFIAFSGCCAKGGLERAKGIEPSS